MSAAPLLVYLHGFNSSPLSRKATELGAYLSQYACDLEYWVPQLPLSPRAAMALVERRLAAAKDKGQQVCLIGSSLGGYYALHLAEAHGIRSALINPAMRPYDLLQNHLGECRNYHTEEVARFEASYLQELKAIETLRLSVPSSVFLLVQTADDVLDYRQSTRQLHGVPAWIEGGGHHEFTGFERAIPAILSFLLRSGVHQ